MLLCETPVGDVQTVGGEGLPLFWTVYVKGMARVCSLLMVLHVAMAQGIRLQARKRDGTNNCAF